MPRIKAIKNFTAVMDEPKAAFWRPTGLLFQPDEAIVRQISYATTVKEDGVLLVWCSLVNDYIGTFTAGENYSVSVAPNTLLLLSGATPNQVMFRIDAMDPITSAVVPRTDLEGHFAISIDFIKY